MRDESEAEFRDYVAARASRLRRTAYLICGDWHRADDVVQSALVTLYLNWDRVRDRGSLDAYVRAALVTRAVDESRRPWRRERATHQLPDTAVPEGMALEDRELVRAALRRLPARQRAVVVLRFFEDVDVAETARLLGCSEGTVKTHTARALTTLRTVLDDRRLVPIDRDGGTP